MHLHAVLLLVHSFSQSVTSLQRSCGTSYTTPELDASHARLASLESAGKPAYLPATISINTYIHILVNGSSSEEGGVPDEQVYAQVRLLLQFILVFSLTVQMDIFNEDYEGTGISFALKGITRSNNSDWQVIAEFSEAELAMKTALRTGGYNAMNIYVTTLEFNLLGYAYVHICPIALRGMSPVTIS